LPLSPCFCGGDWDYRQFASSPGMRCGWGVAVGWRGFVLMLGGRWGGFRRAIAVELEVGDNAGQEEEGLCVGWEESKGGGIACGVSLHLDDRLAWHLCACHVCSRCTTAAMEGLCRGREFCFIFWPFSKSRNKPSKNLFLRSSPWHD
jgi:hypothetical protein